MNKRQQKFIDVDGRLALAERRATVARQIAASDAELLAIPIRRAEQLRIEGGQRAKQLRTEGKELAEQQAWDAAHPPLTAKQTRAASFDARVDVFGKVDDSGGEDACHPWTGDLTPWDNGVIR